MKEAKTRYGDNVLELNHVFKYYTEIYRQAVEDNFNDLQAQIEACHVQHAASMALFSSKMEEAKKQNIDMSDRVSHIPTYTASTVDRVISA